MSAHVGRCDVETNGGSCSCAEHWMERAERLDKENTDLVGVLDRFKDDLSALHPVLKAAKAWRRARDAEAAEAERSGDEYQRSFGVLTAENAMCTALDKVKL